VTSVVTTRARHGGENAGVGEARPVEREVGQHTRPAAAIAATRFERSLPDPSAAAIGQTVPHDVEGA